LLSALPPPSVQAEFVRADPSPERKTTLLRLKKAKGTLVAVPMDFLGQEI
jgi:hypothetical protein